MTDGPLLQVRELGVGFPCPRQGPRMVLEHVGFELAAGQSLAIVGESGSGKTMLGKALLGLLPEAARVSAGSVLFEGRELLGGSAGAWRALRGRGIGMVFQDPMVALNPALRVGEQLAEALVGGGLADARRASTQAAAMLERTRVRDPLACMRRYPHQCSAGMRQRIMLAAVMLLKPRLLIADEPTSALDCLMQKEVLDLLLELTAQEGTALIFISHNLTLVAARTERVLVLGGGRALECGPAAQVLARPAHPATLQLLDALPRRDPGRVPAAAGAPVLEVRELAVDYRAGHGWPGRRERAVHPASLALAPGETLALVGESGSGKSSLAKAIMGLVEPASGAVVFDGHDLRAAGKQAMRRLRPRLQMLFQDASSALDPRMRVAALVAEGLRMDRSLERAARAARVLSMLAEVGLAPDFADRWPHQLSGGQRQRVAIARALVGRPAVLIADEPVSALDATLQMQVLRLLSSLQQRYGFALLLISHDLGVVEQLADRVVVMLHGYIVEEGSRAAVFNAPCHPYTRRLLQAVPELQGDRAHGFFVARRCVPAQLQDHRYFQPGRDEAPARRLIALPGEGDGLPPHRVAIVA